MVHLPEQMRHLVEGRWLSRYIPIYSQANIDSLHEFVDAVNEKTT